MTDKDLDNLVLELNKALRTRPDCEFQRLLLEAAGNTMRQPCALYFADAYNLLDDLGLTIKIEFRDE